MVVKPLDSVRFQIHEICVSKIWNDALLDSPAIGKIGTFVPAEFVGGMKQDQGMWGGMKAIVPTIPHAAAFMTEFMKGKPLPAGYWVKVKVPVLVADGGASPAWLHNAAEALAKELPHASRQTLEDQTHQVDAKVLAPVLIEFYKE